ncbi:MAG: futalosine hydrolase [Nitrospirota bacterium]|nr:MAG: futalosine hydrolase [Nitrospirota bacterium]
MKSRIRIGLICSVPEECGDIISMLSHKKTNVSSGVRTVTGRIGIREVSLMISGIGKVNAAHASTVLIDRFKPSRMINFGIGGGYKGSGLKIGDVAVSEMEIYADEGIMSSKGFSGIEKIGIPLVSTKKERLFNRFPADKSLLKKAVAIKGISGKGRFLTVSSVSGDSKRAAQLRRMFGGICENMEGAAVFHVARIHGIAPLAIRGISNVAGDRDKRKWNIKEASLNCQSVLAELIERI